MAQNLTFLSQLRIKQRPTPLHARKPNKNGIFFMLQRGIKRLSFKKRPISRGKSKESYTFCHVPLSRIASHSL
jgi:hypothetical protein